MEANSFGQRVDPTTEQLSWKKVLLCSYNELNTTKTGLEVVIWFLSNILGIFARWRNFERILILTHGVAWLLSSSWSNRILEFRGWALVIMHLTNFPPEFHFYNFECIN